MARIFSDRCERDLCRVLAARCSINNRLESSNKTVVHVHSVADSRSGSIHNRNENESRNAAASIKFLILRRFLITITMASAERRKSFTKCIGYHRNTHQTYELNIACIFEVIYRMLAFVDAAPFQRQSLIHSLNYNFNE